MALSETKIANAALAKIGSKRLNDLDTDSSPQAIHCRTHYEMTRDSLLRSHFWRFASARETLSQDTTDPKFEWDNQFILPDDFMRLKSIYEDGTHPKNTRHTFAIEGQRLLTDESSCEIRYIKKVIDVTEFDPLFVELLVLLLAKKLVGPLAGASPKLVQEIKDDIKNLMPSVRALDRQETTNIGRADRFTWVDVRQTRGGRIDSRLGSN